jgi:hypothetical protein
MRTAVKVPQTGQTVYRMVGGSGSNVVMPPPDSRVLLRVTVLAVRDNYVPVRMNDQGLKLVDHVADEAFEGNRSAAMRRLLALGLDAWAKGIQTPDQIRKPIHPR